MMTKERYELLCWQWESETNDEETQEWRDDLTEEEQALVNQWDYGFNDSLRRLYQDQEGRREA